MCLEMGKPISESAREVGALPRQAVSPIVTPKHTSSPPLGLLAGGHPSFSLWTVYDMCAFPNSKKVVKSCPFHL